MKMQKALFYIFMVVHMFMKLMQCMLIFVIN